MAILGAPALTLALLAAGCGPESHSNDPRPPIATEITVNISDKAVQVQPASAGVSADEGQPLSQNAGVKQPEADPDQPLVVNFTISNTTETDTALEIRGGDIEQRSGPIVAQGNALLKVALPTGEYEITAADIPAAKEAGFTVGPVRTSSQNALLLP